jgi:hypothetical protein
MVPGTLRSLCCRGVYAGIKDENDLVDLHAAHEARIGSARFLNAARTALNVIYHFKQRLCYLVLRKHKTRQQCQKLAPVSWAP